MIKDKKIHGSYVEKVRQGTERYVRELLDENKKIRLRLAGLESSTASLEREKARLGDENRGLRAELERESAELERLRRRLTGVEEQSRRHSEQYVHVEQQNTDLANLYVAGYRLHGTLDREEVLQAIQEIIINLIGCEELGVFELNPDGSRLELAASYGLDAESYASLPVGSGLIGRAAASGETFLAGQDDSGRSPEEEHLTACIPLRVGDRATGAVAIFRLLPQKVDGLGTVDHELLDLLASQAGVALYSTALHARFCAGEAAGGAAR